MKNSYKILIVSLLSISTFAQQATEIDPKFIKLPRYANLAAIDAVIPMPTQGTMVYNIDTKTNWFYNGTAWTNTTSTSVPSPLYLSSASTTITGETNQADEAGVMGVNTTTGIGNGVLGRTTSTNPDETTVGVKGENMSTNGIGYGVMGRHEGTGWAGHFEGTNALSTNGAIKFGGSGVGTPAAGKVLTATDATGNATWQSLYPRLSYDAILTLPTPQEGDIAYDNTFKCLRVYTGTKWVCTNPNTVNESNLTAIATSSGSSVFSTTRSQKISVDASGNVYITGYFEGTTTFGTTSISSAGGYEIFLAKYNSSGVLQWVQKAGGVSDDIAYGIGVDATGNVYLTGSFFGTATFGSTPVTSAGDTDIFLAKYNNTGTLQWIQKAGGTGGDRAEAIALDASGNVYISGAFIGTATFGVTPKTSAGSTDIFMAKYNSAGAVQWVQSAGGTLSDNASGIAVNASGFVYLTGTFNGTATFGSTSKTSAGSSDIFIAKYDPVGSTWSWVQTAGGTSFDYGNDIAIDASGNAYTTGAIAGTATFGATSKTSAGSYDVFMAKYSTGGVLGWVQTAGGTSFDYGLGISVDASGNVYITGIFSDISNFGSTAKTSVGGEDIFILKYNTAGTMQWVHTMGGISNDAGKGIAVDASGNVYSTGHFVGAATFGLTPKTSPAGNDMFIARVQQ